MEEISTNILETINYVEGFNPMDFLINLAPFGSTEKQLYMPVHARLLWFHLKYPNGVIRKKIIKLDEKMVIVEAKAYADRADTEDQYLSSAWAQRYYDSSTSFGIRYVECAETSAEGRTLGKAGFGSQYSEVDPDEPNELNPVDSPTKAETKTAQVKLDATQAQTKDSQTDSEKNTFYLKMQARANKQNPYQNQTEKQKPEDSQPQDDAKSQSVQVIQEKQKQQVEQEKQKQQVGQQVEQEKLPEQQEQLTSKTQSGSEKAIPNKDMSEEEISRQMTIEFAKSVVSTVTAGKGRKLGELMTSTPTIIQWIANRYVGADKILKAAAICLWTHKDNLTNTTI